MKRKSFIIAALIIGMITCFASCKKKTVEPTSDPETPTWNHTQHVLSHVDAVEPTATKNGCIEHYICDSCCALFADAEGKEPLDQVILWATDYGFDFNNDLDFFDQFGGDEPYFDGIAYNSIHEGYPGSTLYPDYEGWESWTRDQWEDYINAVNAYYEELTNESNLFDLEGDDFDVSKVAEFILGAVVKYGAPVIDPQLKRFVNPEGYMIDKIEEILNKLDEIQNSIAALRDQITINEYKRAIDLREEKQAFLRLGTDTYFRQIISKIGNKNFSELSQQELSGIDSILFLWHGIAGTPNDPVTLTMYLLENVNGTFTTDGTTYPEIYDYYAYHVIPWEHEGYALRESLRAADALTMCESYMMCMMYFNRFGGPSIFGLTHNRLNGLMIKYANTLNAHKVVRHPDVRICQIPGAQMKFKQQLHVLDAPTWMLNHKDHNYLLPLFSEQLMTFRNGITDGKGMVLKEIYVTIYEYYHKKGSTASIYSILRDAGFKGLDNGEVLVAGFLGWDPHTGFNTMYYAYEFQIRSYAMIKNKDHIGYRNVLKDDCNLCEMNILNNCNLPGKITNFGQRTSTVFCNLEAVSSKDEE